MQRVLVPGLRRGREIHAVAPARGDHRPAAHRARRTLLAPRLAGDTQAVAALCERPAWIMDGNYTGTLPLRLSRADAVIWLDYPRRLCLGRVLARIAKDHGRVREGMPAGCPERFDLEFLRYVWNFNARSRPRIVAALERRGSAPRLHRLRSDADARLLLQELSRQRAEIPDIPPGEP